jgi:hypothetical protein
MSVPMVSEERVRGTRSPENSVSPVVAGDDSYTAMIRNLLFQVESLRQEDLRRIQESLHSLEADMEELAADGPQIGWRIKLTCPSLSKRTAFKVCCHTSINSMIPVPWIRFELRWKIRDSCYIACSA